MVNHSEGRMCADRLVRWLECSSEGSGEVVSTEGGAHSHFESFQYDAGGDATFQQVWSQL